MSRGPWLRALMILALGVIALVITSQILNLLRIRMGYWLGSLSALPLVFIAYLPAYSALGIAAGALFPRRPFRVGALLVTPFVIAMAYPLIGPGSHKSVGDFVILDVSFALGLLLVCMRVASYGPGASRRARVVLTRIGRAGRAGSNKRVSLSAGPVKSVARSTPAPVPAAGYAQR